MREYIALDVHKHYTMAEREGVDSRKVKHHRIEHEHGAIKTYLRDAQPGTTVAVETAGNWYWIVDEIEAAGCQPPTDAEDWKDISTGAVLSCNEPGG